MSHLTLEVDESLTELTDALFESRAVIEAQLRQIVPHVDVGDIDRHLPLSEEADLHPADRVALLRGIAEATNVVLRADTLDDTTSLDELARALAATTLINRWHVTITFVSEDGFATAATAVMNAGLDQLSVTGEARKNPCDPYVVDVGHEIAAARALAELARQLLDVATSRITEWDDNAERLTS